MAEHLSPKEREAKKDTGVAAFFSFEGKMYGIPMQSDDSNKFEIVINKAFVPLSFGYLKDKSVGLIGGAVEMSKKNKRMETLEEALRREIIEELSETLKRFGDHEELPDLSWSQPMEVENFTVVQTKQDKVLVSENEIRGIFKIFISEIKLTQEQFTRLRPILKELNVDNVEKLRPFLAELVKTKQLHIKKDLRS